MCFGRAPTIAAPVAELKPEVLHNPFLDSSDTRTITALRTGRSSLRIKLPGEDTIGFGGTRTQAARIGAVGTPSGNARIQGRRGLGGAPAKITASQQIGLDRLNRISQPEYRADQLDRFEEAHRRKLDGD